MKVKRLAASKLLPVCVFSTKDNQFVDVVTKQLSLGNLSHKEAEWLIINYYQNFAKVLVNLERSLYD